MQVRGMQVRVKKLILLFSFHLLLWRTLARGGHLRMTGKEHRGAQNREKERLLPRPLSEIYVGVRENEFIESL